MPLYSWALIQNQSISNLLSLQYSIGLYIVRNFTTDCFERLHLIREKRWDKKTITKDVTRANAVQIWEKIIAWGIIMSYLWFRNTETEMWNCHRVIERFRRFPLQSLQNSSEDSGTWSLETYKQSINCWLSTILTNTLSISSKVSPWNRGYRIRTIHHDLKEGCVFANRLSLVPNLVNGLGGNI